MKRAADITANTVANTVASIAGLPATAPVIIFADPYKRCLACDQWVDGYVALPEGSGAPVLVPCGHASYRDVCASWSPVDGCGCEDHNARHLDDPIRHDRPLPCRRPGNGAIVTYVTSDKIF